MSESELIIIKTIEGIIRSIVDDVNSVNVLSNKVGGSLFLEVSVSNDDRGKVIGRGGHTARCLRHIATCLSAKHQCRVILEILG